MPDVGVIFAIERERSQEGNSRSTTENYLGVDVRHEAAFQRSEGDKDIERFVKEAWKAVGP